MQLNEAVSKRLSEFMQAKDMTQYQLFMKSGVPKSTISNIINCTYPS
ncbi:MAG: helix-turn-helix transcriptional regulator, partial [Bacteroidaceae bacterium]|nr:helix-turn-helix transcriptional regulator [Bacteroidaceae bacterium]